MDCEEVKGERMERGGEKRERRYVYGKRGNEQVKRRVRLDAMFYAAESNGSSFIPHIQSVC